MRARDLPRDPQAESEPADMAGGDGALEAIEDALAIRIGDADPMIAHAHSRVAAVLLHADDDRSTASVLDRVREQIVDHLLHAHRIPGADDVVLRVEGDLRAHAFGGSLQLDDGV